MFINYLYYIIDATAENFKPLLMRLQYLMIIIFKS